VGVGNKSVSLRAGELVVFAPGQDHALLEASEDLDLFVMALKPELAARMCDRSLLLTERTELSGADLRAATRELSEVNQITDPSVIELRLATFFAKARAPQPGAHVLSRRALERLRAEPDLSGSDLSRYLRSGVSGISRHFHRDLGVRLVEYRARLRLMEFVRIVDRGHTFTHAALAADFGSYAQCHRVFRRVLGCAPSEYFSGARERVNDALFDVE